MKQEQIQQGGVYSAKVSGKLVRIRVDRIRTRQTYNGAERTVYDCTNTATGRAITVKSAQRFRGEPKPGSRTPP